MLFGSFFLFFIFYGLNSQLHSYVASTNRCNMVKRTEILLTFTTTIMFLGKDLKVVAKCSLNWIYFHDDLYCCVK